MSTAVDNEQSNETFKYVGNCSINMKTEIHHDQSEERYVNDPLRITDISLICNQLINKTD